MAKLILPIGTTSKTLRIFVQDSSQTDGRGLTGLAFGSAGLIWYWLREGDATPTAVSIVTASVGTYTSGGFVEVDSTHLPGVYEIGVPNAALNSGHQTFMMLSGATHMVPVPLEVQLTDWNFTTTGTPDTNLVTWKGSIPQGLAVDGAVISQIDNTTTPSVNLVQWRGSTPNNLVSGKVDSTATVSGSVTVGGYASGQDPATSIMAAAIDGTFNFKQYIRAIGATTSGGVSGAPGSPAFLSLDGLTTYVSGDTDSSGDRFTITYNL
jgi:hypothetical protein